jgi:hypothetical protein
MANRQRAQVKRFTFMKKKGRYTECSQVCIFALMGVSILFFGTPALMAQESYLPLPAPPVPGTSWTPFGFLMFGVMLGVIGQVARVAVGIKKEMDDPKTQTAKWSTWFNTPELVVSLLLGGAAGAICCVTLWGDTIDKTFIIACVAAGYAGSDFIQGFVQRHAGASSPPSPTPPAIPMPPSLEAEKKPPVVGQQDAPPQPIKS